MRYRDAQPQTLDIRHLDDPTNLGGDLVRDSSGNVRRIELPKGSKIIGTVVPLSRPLKPPAYTEEV